MSIKNNLNPWGSAPTQTPRALPRKKQDTSLWKFHEYQPRVLAPSQTVTAVPNPQQVAVDPGTHDYYYSNQEYFAPSQTVPAAPNPQEVAVDPGTQDYYSYQYLDPYQTLTAVPNPHQLAVASSTHDYYSSLNSDPSQTVTAFPNSHQVAVASSTPDYYSYQQYSNPGQFVTVVPGTQQVPEVVQPPLEVQDQVERDPSATLSYAKTIWIEIDDESLKKLKFYGEAKIQQWAGKRLNKVISGSQKNMTLYDAKMINANAPEPIIPTTLPKVKVVTFTVDSIIHDRLKPITAGQIKVFLKKIGVDEAAFNSLKHGTGTVKTEDAEKYNKYFRRYNLGANTQNTDIFDLERILNLGNAEPIEKKLEALIKVEPEHQEKLTEMSKSGYLLHKIFKKNFFQINKNTQKISLKNAILINRISGDEIFKINEESVQKYSIHQGQVKEVEFVLEVGGVTDSKIRALMHKIKNGSRKFVTAQEAKDLNVHLNKNQFDFASYLSSATQEAEEAFKQLADLPNPARGKKRKSKALSENPAKKRRSGANDQQTALSANQGSFQGPPPPVVAFSASVTMPQESIISPEMTVTPGEFGGSFDSNATAETNHSESSSSYSSPSNSSEVIKGFEFGELNNSEMEFLWNSENTNVDWSDWNFNLNQ